MKRTRDEAEKLVDILVITTNLVSDALRFGVPTREEAEQEQLKAKEALIAALITDTEMYEGEPKEEWRKTEEKIEACMSSIKTRVYNHDNRHSWDHPTDYLVNEIKEILTNHFGGKP